MTLAAFPASRRFLAFLGLATSLLAGSPASAADTTPPLLSIDHTWIEKAGSQFAFKLLLDPRDETGIDKVQHRFKINSTVPVPDTTAWTDFSWQRGTPLVVQQVCNSIVVEVRALDAAGNASAIQRRVFAKPFPLGVAPNLTPRFEYDKVFTAVGPVLDCRGLFGADFDGNGLSDIMQVDRAFGLIKVRRQNTDGTYSSSGSLVGANAVSDSAMGDFNGDGRPDVALVLNDALVVYQNDGSSAPQFSQQMNVAGLATAGISTVVGIAAGDVTGEGKPDIIITGTGDDGAMGTVAKIAVLINNDQFQLGASNNAFAYSASSAGIVRLGDVTGDGWADAVMVDAANNRVLTFVNKANGSFGGASDPDTSVRPIATNTIRGAAHAIAVGDVTGDGRADLVATFHGYGDLYGLGQPRNYLDWALLDSRGAAPFGTANGFNDGGTGPIAASAVAFRSDIMLQDLTGDRFPEVVVATPFAVNEASGVRAWRMTCQLDNANLLTFSSGESFSYQTSSVNPHRLAVGIHYGARPQVLLASGDNAEQVQYIYSSAVRSTKTYEVLGAVTTDSDTNGTVLSNGVTTYDAYIGGLITYSVTYVNNGTTAITGGVVECAYPSAWTVESGDGVYTEALSGATKIIRWTQDIPAGSSGVKTFSVRVLGGTVGSAPGVGASLKRGTTKLAGTIMPKVILAEPLLVTMEVDTTSDPSGNRAHIGESIYYRYTIENQASGPMNNFKLAMKVPTAQTSLIGATSPPQPVLAGTFPNYSEITFTNLSLAGGAELERYVRLEVKSSVASGTVIKNTAATVTRSDGKKVLGPVASVRIDPPLELTLEANKTTVRPGDTIRYTFKAKNWLNSNFTGAKVVNQLPLGTSLFTAAANDAVDSGVGGRGNFRYSAGTWTAAQLSPTTIPAYDRSTKIMTWNFDVLPAGVERTIEFDVVVGGDVPTTFNFLGTPYPLQVHNTGFNLVGTTTGGVRIFAGKPIGGTAANNPAATPDKLLTYYLTESHSHTELSNPPLTPPLLTLVKEALGDGVFNDKGQRFTTVINDPAVPGDALCDFRLTANNKTGGGLARAVTVRDYLPKDMTFVGHMERNGSPVASLVGYHFYDPQGKEMPVIGAESFTDSSGNGFWDFGEPYTDANNNKKYDGPIAVQIRSMDLPAGDLSGGGSAQFIYRAITSFGEGKIIISDAGGIAGVKDGKTTVIKDGLQYTKVPGYHLTADNLHFPVNGTPDHVRVRITSPAAITMPVGTIKSRSTFADNQAVTITLPYEVQGALGVALSGMKMETLVPKGFQVALAQVWNTAGQVVQKYVPGATDNTFSLGAPDASGARKLTFPLGSASIAFPVVKISVDPATKSALLNKAGETTKPLVLDPVITGSYAKPSTARTATAAAPPSLIAMAKFPTKAVVPLQADTSKDAKIFVGRSAPAFVTRDQPFSFTIFVGNLKNIPLQKGLISMNVPAGCDYVSASLYTYNYISSVTGDESSATYSASAPKHSAGKVTWDIGSFQAGEAGAVTLTVKVRKDFSGTTIYSDANSCVFDVVNAYGKSPGPIGIPVLGGNETTQAPEAATRALNGLLPAIPADFLTGGNVFQSDIGRIITTTGGADILQITNGVVVVQLGRGRVIAVGDPSKVLASGIRLISNSPSVRVAIGSGDDIQLTQLPYPVGSPQPYNQPANNVLANLHIAANSLVAAGGGNLVAAGGGNLVAAGAGNLVGNDGASLVGQDGATLVGQDGSTFTSIASLVAAGGGHLVGQDGSTLVAAGGGNLVAAGGGNIVAVGAGHLVGNDGASLIGQDGGSLVAAGAGNLIGQDGGSLVAAGGGNLVAAGAGNLVNAGGLNLIVNPK